MEMLIAETSVSGHCKLPRLKCGVSEEFTAPRQVLHSVQVANGRGGVTVEPREAHHTLGGRRELKSCRCI